MKEDDDILAKSYDLSNNFANRTIRLCRYLCDNKEFVLSRRLLRSGTSIGVYVREAQRAAFRKDSITQLNIALKESYETEHLLELLRDNDYITSQQFDSMFGDCRELTNNLSKIITTSKQE